jgi:hypothetical protein
MMMPQTILGDVEANLFRPCLIQMANGRTFDVRHSEIELLN